MPRLLPALFVALALGPSPCPADDSIRARLDKAKTVYEVEADRLQKLLKENLDQRETAARKDGNKKALDDIRADRAAFEAGGTLPAAVPPKVRQGYETAAAGMIAAYEKAVKEYVRAKMDDEAEGVERELAAFKKARAPGVPTAKDKVTGKWSWGPDKHVLTFAADGTVTEHLPAGQLSTTGIWKKEKTGTVTVRLKNGYSAVVTLTAAEDGMQIELTDPAGRRSSLSGERLAK